MSLEVRGSQEVPANIGDHRILFIKKFLEDAFKRSKLKQHRKWSNSLDSNQIRIYMYINCSLCYTLIYSCILGFWASYQKDPSKKFQFGFEVI